MCILCIIIIIIIIISSSSSTISIIIIIIIIYINISMKIIINNSILIYRGYYMVVQRYKISRWVYILVAIYKNYCNVLFIL